MPGLDAWCFTSQRRHSSRVRTSSWTIVPAIVTTVANRQALSREPASRIAPHPSALGALLRLPLFSLPKVAESN